LQTLAQFAHTRSLCLSGLCLALLGHRGWAVERVTLATEGRVTRVAGQVLVEAQDGGLLLEGSDRRIWTLLPDQIRSRETDAEPFRYLTREELAKSVVGELPAGFRVHETAHYLICYNTSREYAQWCGALFERLYRAFFNFWQRQGFDVNEPDVLVALVFRDHDSYATYGRPELGDASQSIIGYYSLATNRITTYDLTGIEQLRQPGDRIGSTKHINQILARPAAARTVATVIHEATHQLAFNSGLQHRFADNPLWLSEGLAIYFEAPDLSSSRGWRKIGALHETRLQTLRDYLSSRPPDSLVTLITSDQRFRDTQQAEVAYAEAWALCYYLMRQRSAPFAAYLRRIGDKPVLGEDSADRRLQEFEQALGQRWQELDAEFLRAVASWR
jgi:hypothetical protein